MVQGLLDAAGGIAGEVAGAGGGGGYGPIRNGGSRRDRLRGSDQVPYKCLCLSGPSRVDSIDLKTLHGLVSKGDKYVAFYSDLYSSDLARRAIHVSRDCGLQLAFAEKILACPVAKGILAAGVLAGVKKERDRLKDAWAVLHVAQAASQNGSLRYAQGDQTRSRDQVVSSAKLVYAHCVGPEAEKSIIRQLSQFFGMGGLPYVAFTMDKVLRAYLLYGNDGTAVSEEEFTECCVKRFVLGEGGETNFVGAEAGMESLMALGGA